MCTIMSTHPLYSLARPLLFAFDAERAHDLALRALDAAHCTGVGRMLAAEPARLPTRVFGLEFPNPVGLAAGLDKNGEHVEALFALGFGFVEIGTVTPEPQPGNPRPRMFRLPEHHAIINRLGFNNLGVDALVRQVERITRRPGVLGINIGKNKHTPNAEAGRDYLKCLERVYPLADYVTVNISSPNTEGLRDLQGEAALRRLIGELRERQLALAAQHAKQVPMLVKIAPDLDETGLDAIAQVLTGQQVDGVIATNTTLAREGVNGHRHAGESGGLSGAPLMERSTRILHELRTRLPASIPLIGVGGITSGADAAAKIAAGASLVQCYSGLVYRGPGLIQECVNAIAAGIRA